MQIIVRRLTSYTGFYVGGRLAATVPHNSTSEAHVPAVADGLSRLYGGAEIVYQ